MLFVDKLDVSFRFEYARASVVDSVCEVANIAQARSVLSW